MEPSTTNLGLRIAIVLGIALLFPVMVYAGASSLTERPAYPRAELAEPRVVEKGDPSSEQREQLQEAHKAEMEAYEDKLRAHSQLIFWVTLPLGLAALALGALPRLGDISTGLILGGVATLVAGQVDASAYLPSYLKFLAFLAALLLLLFVAWRRLNLGRR